MKTFRSCLIAICVAAIIASLTAAIPWLFEPLIGVWIIFMLLIISVFDYGHGRRRPLRHQPPIRVCGLMRNR